VILASVRGGADIFSALPLRMMRDLSNTLVAADESCSLFGTEHQRSIVAAMAATSRHPIPSDAACRSCWRDRDPFDRLD